MTALSFPVEYFRKRAKGLLAQVRAVDVGACQRVRRIYDDMVARSDAEVASSFGLMRAQHVVAVEHGFARWDAMMNASPIEARLAITMNQVPLLNDFGIGIYAGDRKKPKTEQDEIRAKDTAKLRSSVAEVEATVQWLLENVQPTKTINKLHTSYGLKHIAEKDIGYITNGVFIAAGIIAGYPYEILPDSPNVPFGMSEKSIKDLGACRRNPERILKQYLPIAIKILGSRGIKAHVPRAKNHDELVWMEDGEVRTLKIGAVETSPFLVRLFVDHYTLMVSRTVAGRLGIDGGYYAQARPTWPSGEITVLPHEVPNALHWALAFDARLGQEPPAPPFERSLLHGRPSATDAWSYVWSNRAVEAYRRTRGRSHDELAVSISAS